MAVAPWPTGASEPVTGVDTCRTAPLVAWTAPRLGLLILPEVLLTQLPADAKDDDSERLMRVLAVDDSVSSSIPLDCVPSSLSCICICICIGIGIGICKYSGDDGDGICPSSLFCD